ncbi:MAG: glycosyltransferase family 4 protein [Chloroflexi bacterium]|nr:glycosyltransferase family 4 protein [Chloroflexota bacterium]
MFCAEFRGSYMFGYIAALKQAGVRTVIICISARVDAPTRRTHAPTGATVYFLPMPRLYRAVHWRMTYPYGQTVRETFGELRGAQRLLLPLYAATREIALYLATPLESLARVIRQEGCDAILCQEYEYPRFDVSAALGKWLRLPVFATFQGGNYHHRHLERFSRPLALRASAGLIIAPQREANRVQARYGVPPTKIARIFNPIDLSVWKPADRIAARTALGIPTDARVVAWHGRVAIHKKGLDILLDAWERLYRARPQQTLRLVLIGTGDDAAELQQRVAKIPSVIWINRFINDPSELAHYLSAADVYAFPSRYEGFPVALIEAMACGLPVVAADADGVSDILAERGGGIVVPREDTEAFTTALGRLFDDSDLTREMGRQARQRAEATCSLQSVGEQLRDFLLNARVERVACFDS